MKTRAETLASGSIMSPSASRPRSPPVAGSRRALAASTGRDRQGSRNRSASLGSVPAKRSWSVISWASEKPEMARTSGARVSRRFRGSNARQRERGSSRTCLLHRSTCSITPSPAVVTKRAHGRLRHHVVGQSEAISPRCRGSFIPPLPCRSRGPAEAADCRHSRPGRTARRCGPSWRRIAPPPESPQ